MLTTPKGVATVAPITELRSNTVELAERTENEAVLVTRNNEPYLIVCSPDQWEYLQEKASFTPQTDADEPRPSSSTTERMNEHGSDQPSQDEPDGIPY